MNFFNGVARLFGLNGQAEEDPDADAAVETETPDDEETKTDIEIEADKAEELLRIAGIEQKASVETFGQTTINLRGRLSEILESEGKDDESVSAIG